MYQKICSKNVFLAITVFIMIHIHLSVAHMERNTNLKKFLKYDNKRTFWLKQKRTSGYRDPCETETNIVDTRSYDSCSDCTYLPEKLTEVKCITNGLTRSSCKYNIAGDCLDVIATIQVLKIFSNENFDLLNVNLKVGCACHLLPK